MSFTWPLALPLLLLVPLFVYLYVWGLRRRSRYKITYSNVSLVRSAAGSSSPVKRHLPAALYLGAMAALILALSRPHATIASPEVTGTVILVLDVSGSMRADDIRPSRIDAATASIRNFVRRQPNGIKVGLVTFAGSAFLAAPPSEDKEALLDTIAFLQLYMGTNIGAGLETALDAILVPLGTDSVFLNGQRVTPTPVTARPANADAAVIVLLSDGASTTGPPPLRIAERAAAAGIRTYTVGLGRADPGISQLTGRRSMQLDEPTLAGIADITGGKYFTAESSGELHSVYRDLEREFNIVKKEQEVTFLAAAVGVLLMAVSGVLSAFWSAKLP